MTKTEFKLVNAIIDKFVEVDSDYSGDHLRIRKVEEMRKELNDTFREIGLKEE